MDSFFDKGNEWDNRCEGYIDGERNERYFIVLFVLGYMIQDRRQGRYRKTYL